MRYKQLLEQVFAMWPNAEVTIDPATHEITVRPGLKTVAKAVAGFDHSVSYCHHTCEVKPYINEDR